MKPQIMELFTKPSCGPHHVYQYQFKIDPSKTSTQSDKLVHIVITYNLTQVL